ncbi:MAG: hypothetical protein QME81_13250 [bacterium]|nr:hypothetical protein [bacterium]
MGFFQNLWWKIKEAFRGGGDAFLCDTCRYDYPSACHRPERPNATRCPEYKPR